MGVALVIVGLTLFGWFGVKGYKDFADIHTGHLDRWMDYVNARDNWNRARRACAKVLKKVHTRRMEIHNEVRNETREYEDAIKSTRCAAAGCQSSLEAQSSLIPSLTREYTDTAMTLVTLYRECSGYWRRRRNEMPDKIALPKLQFAPLPFDIAEDQKHVAHIVSILDENREQLRRFREQFEAYVANVTRAAESAGDEESQSVSRSHGNGKANGFDKSAAPRTTTSADGKVTAWPDNS
jgi:hypothetical protein